MEWRPRVSYRVLIADHDPALLESCRRFFPRHSWELAGASSGLECVVQLRRFLPHVLILEPSIPWGGGAGVLAQMRCELDVPLVPVIVLADRRKFDALSGLLEFPVHDFAIKPLSLQNLAFKIRYAVHHLPLDSDRSSPAIRQTVSNNPF